MPTQTSFGKFAQAWDSQIGENGCSVEAINIQIPIVFDMLGSLKDKRVYEIACGNGFLARRLVKVGTKEVVASDVSQELIEIARTKYDNKKIIYQVREGTDFRGFKSGSFDAVVINQGIFYIEDLDALFKGIQKILKPGGVLVFNILHPLFPAFRLSVGETSSMGEPVDVVALAKKYPQSYTQRVKKVWDTDGKTKVVFYSTFKRPVSVYTNTAAKHGLLIARVEEPPSATTVNGKIKKSPIPASFIIKCVKVD